MNRALPSFRSASDMDVNMNWADNQHSSAVETQSSHRSRNLAQIMGVSCRPASQGGDQIPATSQLSPTSTAMDTQIDASSAPTMTNSTSSSCEESWGAGNPEQDEADLDVHWEQGSDDVLTVPKLEPVDDEFDFDDLKAAPLAPDLPSETSNNPELKQKRPRGRPRKHPLNAVVSANKVTKGRSKTGCITCRKRKKKCDEAKPRCMNCEKNAVVCEGYHEKQVWKSGKEKAEEERFRRESLPNITLHPLFHGVETPEDQIFWKYYINHFSNVLTVEGESKNAFKDIILHLANQHLGLMHSILSVSSKHIDFDSPYGVRLLRDNPSITRKALEERSDHHHDEAMKRFYEDIANSVDKNDPEFHTDDYQTILSARYAQILCRLLQTRAEGNPTGEHRLHLKAYQTLIEHSPPQDPAFYAFITEIFQYHIYADDLFWHPDLRVPRLSSEEWEPLTPIDPPRLLGVADGLLRYMAVITGLRNTIRDNMKASNDPPVDYVMLFRAAEINSAIQDWTPQWPAGDSRACVGLLYKQTMFIYLFRTIYPPSASFRSTISGLSSMPSSASPTPQRRASMAASVVSTASAPVAGPSYGLQGMNLPHSCPSSRNPSRHNSMHEADTRSAYTDAYDKSEQTSPPPKRRPALDDPRLISAVDESLTILESFNPSEPVQILLLIPCMLVGIACFDPDRRDRVRKAIRSIRGYTGLRNCDRVEEVLEEVWAHMDKGDWVAAWDWQAVARRISIDVPCT